MAINIDKKSNIVRLKDKNGAVIGSGVLYYEKNLGDRVYVLTAAHCLYEDGDKFEHLLEEISIEVYSYEKITYQPIVVSDINASAAISSEKDADYAVIVLNKQDVFAINSNLCPVQIVNNCADAKNLMLLGFPKANEHKEVLPSNVTLIEERIGEKQFLLNLDQGFGSFFVQGYSGGGVFVENNTNECILLGLFVRMQANEERGHFGYGQYLKEINGLLEKNRLPIVNFAYYGVNGLTHIRLSSICEKSKKNLGPDYGIDVKTNIQPYLNAICRNTDFFKDFKDILNKWFHDILFYKNETSSNTGLLEKEFCEIKNSVSQLINGLELRLPNEIDFSKCMSLVNDFKLKVEALRDTIYGQLRTLTNESCKQEREGLNNYLSRLYALERYCNGFDLAITNTNYKFANSPIGIIEGEAGSVNMIHHTPYSVVKPTVTFSILTHKLFVAKFYQFMFTTF